MTVDRERRLRCKQERQQPLMYRASKLSVPTYAAAVRDIVDLDRDVFSRNGLVRDGKLTG